MVREFYDGVVIPPAVWKEVVEEGHGRAGAREVEEAVRYITLSDLASLREYLQKNPANPACPVKPDFVFVSPG